MTKRTKIRKLAREREKIISRSEFHIDEAIYLYKLYLNKNEILNLEDYNKRLLKIRRYFKKLHLCERALGIECIGTKNTLIDTRLILDKNFSKFVFQEYSVNDKQRELFREGDTSLKSNNSIRREE